MIKLKNRRKIYFIALTVIIIGVIGLLFWYLSRVDIPLLQPRGQIADRQFRLFVLVSGLLSVVALPVFGLLFFILFKYRDKNHNKKTKYSPDWDHNVIIEALWWVIPGILILVTSVITWQSSYALNPYKPISSNQPAVDIQVISLDWKWLFIYPKYRLAMINKVFIPLNQPIHFYITSNTVMNSFWVPQLAGQIYTMPGIQTQLYLNATQSGIYYGRSANISGIGFAGMQFSVDALTSQQFIKELRSLAQNSQSKLSYANYLQLAKPSQYNPFKVYTDVQNNLFYQVIASYKSMAGGMN